MILRMITHGVAVFAVMGVLPNLAHAVYRSWPDGSQLRPEANDMIRWFV